jgi:hypothetical protein
MNHPEAHNLLDQRKAGADLPAHVVNQALFLTGDLSKNELARVNPDCNQSGKWKNPSFGELHENSNVL